ncbi:tetratricopeptide repeat protein (macronuclear) [Tetrahymena thermophila SB210]|uniref:Tetratricopeptide repeat protein n=1 Tax=Tetrahymena thermophila (strain SB210) TaxID=312017 RepID=I7MD04_TETTS|nr:tetratricopeptide repeat protein [Tetrahymena thermophila SB210]EAR85253.2 tetratricopeptide repeat protein [Tetrahymena thermophila SB210]|eukprot:XP_001032916.2 tetratricopeptide repeat protein [Tetrahymena thermophila SB210]
MGNNPQKPDRLKQIQGYQVNVSDEEQSEKHYQTGNQFLQNEDYDKAKEFFQQSLRYNPKNVKVLTALCQQYRRDNKIYDAFQCVLNKTLIENGFEDQIDDKRAHQLSRIVSLATDFNNDDSEQLKVQPQKQLDFAKKYFILNKALIEILPIMKDDFENIIQQMNINNNKFELMFFIEQYKERFGQLLHEKELLLIDLYNLYGFHQKLLNLYLNQLKQQPNDKQVLEKIIQCYEQLKNKQKVNEYKSQLQKMSEQTNSTQ